MNNFEYTLREYGVTVTCSDELPALVKKRPRWYVVNTDRCGNPGLHWTVFYFPTRGPSEFFDSLGNPPEHYHRRFKNVLMTNGPRYSYLTDFKHWTLTCVVNIAFIMYNNVFEGGP